MKVHCLNPKHVKNPYTKEWIEVPCGHCAACLSGRASSWTNRIQQESFYSKYTIFFTLTYSDVFLPVFNISLLTDCDESFDGVQEIIESDYQSQCLIEHYKGIPYARKREIQLFIKRLRQRIFRCKNISESETFIRYYIVSEYGPTTYRPHYHGILWTESEYFFEHSEEFISQAWTCYNKSTGERRPKGRIDVQSAKGDAAAYVAKYLNSFTYLPEVLQHKQFKPFALFSTCPPIGTHSFSRASLQSILNGETINFTLTKPETYEVVSLPLWRSFEATWFPKCVGYYSLPHRGRISMYALSSRFESFKKLLEFLCSEWQSLTSQLRLSPFPSFTQAFRLQEYAKCEVRSQSDIPLSLQNTLLRQWRISNRVRLLRSKFNMSLYDYVSALERYYSNKDYQCLKAQLQFEVDFVSASSDNLPYLLTFIDPLFYENRRALTHHVRMDYLSQFHLSLESLPKYLFTNSPYYSEQKFKYLEYIRIGKNKKLRNEYLESHPELLKLHSL